MSEEETFTEKLLEVLDNLEKDKRIELIDNMIHRLSFERRVTLLSDRQLEHMNGELSPESRKMLDECKSEKKRDELINGWARANYFRSLAWENYLNGFDENPPCPNDEPTPDSKREEKG